MSRGDDQGARPCAGRLALVPLAVVLCTAVVFPPTAGAQEVEPLTRDHLIAVSIEAHKGGVGDCESRQEGEDHWAEIEVADEEVIGAASGGGSVSCSVTWTNTNGNTEAAGDVTLTFDEEVPADEPEGLTRLTVTGRGSADYVNHAGTWNYDFWYNHSTAELSFSREFTVLEAQRYRVTGSMQGAANNNAFTEIGGIYPDNGFIGLKSAFDHVKSGPFAGDGNFEQTFVLDPGRGYVARISARSFAIPHDPDTDGSPFDLDQGDASFEFRYTFERIGGPDVALLASPPAVSNLRNARFEFEAISEQSAITYECRLDETGEFAGCDSPKEYELADGEHVFEVRSVTDDGVGEPARHEWLVDTIEPTVSIGSGPDSETLEQGAQFEFSGSDGGSGVAGFLCRVDDGEEFACASPQRLAGLAPGDHRFEVRAVDAAGNLGDPDKRDWKVITEGVSAAACPQGTQNRVTFGVIVAVATEVAGCLRRRTIAGDSVLASAGAVSINGVVFRPRAGSLIIVDGALRAGTVGATGPASVTIGPITWSLDEAFMWRGLAQSAAVLNKALKEALSEDSTKVFGLKVTGDVKFELSTDDDGTAKVATTLKLEQPLKAAPGADGQSLAFAFELSASNAKGVDWAFKKITIGQVFLGKVKLKDVELAADPVAQSFEGSATLEIPGRANPKYSQRALKVGLKIAPNGSWGFLHKIGVEVSGVERHLGEGFFLQKLSGAFERAGSKAKLSAGGLVSWLPQIELGPFKGHVLSVDGNLTVSFPTDGGDGPVSLDVEGAGKLVELPVEKVKAGIDSDGKVTYESDLDYSIAGYGAVAKVTGSFFDPESEGFNVEGSGEYRPFLVSDPLELQAVVSRVGTAACFTYRGFGDIDFGWGKRWGEPFTRLGDGNACDVAPFKAQASASQAGAPRTIRVARGTRALVVSGRAEGGPPKLVLDGPGGQTLRTLDGPEPVQQRGRLVIQDATDDSTFVALARPKPGVWTVTSADGRPIEVRFARDLPPIRPRVRVSGRGRKRVLRWRTTATPGQRLTFTETGKGTAHTILTTRRARGRVRFTPHLHRKRKRRVHLLAERNGLPRESRNVARYTAPKPPKLRPVKRLRLRRDRRTITWRRQRAADEYVVAVGLPDGTVTSHTTRRPRHRLPRRLGRKQRARITIVPTASDGRFARPTTRSLKPKRKTRKRRR